MRGMGISFFNNIKKNKNLSRNNVKPVFPLKKDFKDAKNCAENRKINLKKSGLGQISFQNDLQGNPKNNRQISSKTVTGKNNNYKGIPKMVWNSRGQCDETTKLRSKINKVRTYWNRTSLLIPNVFRHVCELKKNSSMLFEYLDLSRKELLVQANGQKAISQAGAPHLQRKNKITKKCSVKKDVKSSRDRKEDTVDLKEIPQFQEERSQDRQDWTKSVKSIQNKLSTQSGENQIKEEKVRSVHSTKTSSEKSQQEIRNEIEKDTLRKIPMIESKEESLKEKKNTLNIKLEKIKKQLREDMNKVHQRIEKSFISEKKKNWTKMDLQAFNKNISEYNQLLDEQDKLKSFQQEKEDQEDLERGKGITQATLERLEKKISSKDSDRIKEQVSLFMKRKGLEGLCQEKDKVKSGQLTLQDILQMELQVSSDHKKPEISPNTKLSRRIQKRRQDAPRKKHSICTVLPSTRKRASSKKTSFFSTNEIRNQEEEEQQILFGFKDEDLLVSVDEDGLEEMSMESLHSLHMSKLDHSETRKFPQIITRN